MQIVTKLQNSNCNKNIQKKPRQKKNLNWGKLKKVYKGRNKKKIV